MIHVFNKYNNNNTIILYIIYYNIIIIVYYYSFIVSCLRGPNTAATLHYCTTTLINDVDM